MSKKLSSIEIEAKSNALRNIGEKASDSIAEKLKGIKKSDMKKAKEIMDSSPVEEAPEEEAEEDSDELSIDEIDAKIAELEKLKASKAGS